MKSKYLIARIPITVEIDSSLTAVIKLFRNFERAKDGKTELLIVIKKGEKNSVILSSNQKVLTISGKNLNNLSDPFNLIGILQATFRFAGLHSCKQKIFLIHGSASVLDGWGICFADDGENIGKTISAIECSLISNEFIGDEFCFLDLRNKSIFSYQFIPLHIREEVKKYLLNEYDKKFKGKIYPETKAGYFIPPRRLFKVCLEKQIKSFYFVHFGDKNDCKMMNKKESANAIKMALTAHILKLLFPQLDRMKFSESTDYCKPIRYSKKHTEKYANRIIAWRDIKNIIGFASCYKISIIAPRNLRDILVSIK